MGAEQGVNCESRQGDYAGQSGRELQERPAGGEGGGTAALI